MFTWSFACTPSPAIAASTSLAFMFDDVPEPVWNTSIGNWSSCLPWATSSPAAAIRSAMSESSLPSSALVRAAAALIRPSQRTTETGTRSPDTGKLSTALRVSPPQSSSATTVSSVELKLHFEAIAQPVSRPASSPRRYCGDVAVHAFQLRLEPAKRLLEQPARALRALLDRADQVAELELLARAREPAR